ncbi:nose resistant to fluoxetine protein 6 [Helicoverpa armigera]|uniref:nose resistant to fluoxetine protein 6 n=1 Tax=Helicoverpa armigera TaxID=29058 RepID=UPI003083854F
MKYIYLIFLGIIAINKIKCHVTDRSKQSDGATTTLPEENETRNMMAKELSEKKLESPKKVQDGETSVYLDDVLFALKNQNWTAEEEPCFNHINRLLHGLQNFTLWAVWDWDSQASEPQGLLFGNRYQLGNFDQCMNAPWSKTHPELKTKYCLAEIVLERTDKAVRRRVDKPYYPYQSALDFIEHRPPHTRPLNELTWGACVPAACAPRTVERLLAVMLARSHLGAAGMRANISISEPCQSGDDEMEYDALFYAFFIVMGSITVIALICTYLNCQQKELDPNSRRTGFIQSFCIKENALDLLRMKKEGIEVFYGIRFFTICLIVLDHQIGISNSGPISDGMTSDQEVQTPLGLLILHDDLFVDTFFLLSGFLTITNIARFKRLPNPLFIILKRYVRLVVAFAVVIFYVCAVYPYTGTGPLWHKAVSHETEQCRKNWWLNLLMLHNYIDTENICIVVSWYIPCDFHFFVVTVLIYCVYRSLPKLGLVLAALVTAAALVLPGIVNYIYDLSAVQLFTFEFIIDPRASKEFHVSYIKSHTRYAAYLVGFYSGYLFVTYSNNGNLNRIRQKWAVLGTCTALTLMLVVMVVGSTFLWRSYYPLEGALYAALNRPAWACGVALLVLCCSFGHVPLVKSFLSWYPWVPLSRLSYGLYLTHTLLITRGVFITRNPQHNDYFEILNSTAGVIFWGCVMALLLWLLAEAPANKLLALCLKRRIKKIMTNRETNQATLSVNTSTSTMPTGSGHLNDNLPDTIHFTSKI